MTLLIGDMGGTKTALAVVTEERGFDVPLAYKEYPSGDYENAGELLGRFLEESNADRPKRAVLGVPGPVVDNSAYLTNLPWKIDGTELARKLDIQSLELMNDLKALACSLPYLKNDDLYTVASGGNAEGGTKAVISCGTGLGEAFLLNIGEDEYFAHPSEGGHADFAPANPLEIEMLEYLFVKYEHVSYEKIASGMGLPHIYEFFRERAYDERHRELGKIVHNSDDPTPVIIEGAMRKEDKCRICIAALNMLAAVLAAEAGNLALKVLATGGVYIGGGIPPKIMPSLKDALFLEAFRRKGRFTEFMADIPVYVILDERAALKGLHEYGFNPDKFGAAVE